MATLPAGAQNLADILLQEKLITDDQYSHAKREYDTTGRSYGNILVNIGAITESVKLGVLTKKCKCEVVSLKDVNLVPLAADRIPRELCVQHTAIPYKVDTANLYVAMEDPTDERAVKQLTQASDLPILFFCAKSSEIKVLIDQIPKKISAESQSRKRIKHLLGLAVLPILAGVPPLGLIALLIFNRPFQDFYRQLEYEQFEQILIFVLVWSAWAIVAYWINGLIFGEPDQEE
ncbi:MAG: hypothetical protein ACFCU1_09175 [Sumerlaeia bacterium]